MRDHVFRLRAVGAATLACALSLCACGRSSATATATERPAAVAELSPRISRPAPERIVAIGDLHGDLYTARRALRLAGAIDEADNWIGGALVVVQTGDEIDRGDDDRAVLDLFERLKASARKAGGEVIPLAGNHELMNASLDFRYVAPKSLAGFSDIAPSAAQGPRLAALGDGARGRGAAFSPGGPYAALLAERPIFVRVGNSVFVHGGILPAHLRYGLDRMNDETHAWLSGARPALPAVVAAEDAPVWTRLYSKDPDAAACATLDEALRGLSAKRMIVGHTVQKGGINAACGERVWRIDTGMSRAMDGGGKVEVIEIRGDTVKVLRAD